MDYAQAHQFTLQNLEEELESERRRDKAGQDADWTNDSGYSDVFDKGGSWENEPQPEDDLPF
jgi:hypothetical protein